MDISVSKFCINIQQTSCTCYDLHKALSWAKREEFCFSFLCGNFLVVIFHIRYENFGEKIMKPNNIFGFLVKKIGQIRF